MGVTTRDDYSAATEELLAEIEGRLGAKWRERIINHAVDALERDLREGGPTQPPSNDQAALQFIRQQAVKIEGYAAALLQAAEWVKKAGTGKLENSGWKAQQIYKVYMEARDEAIALKGHE